MSVRVISCKPFGDGGRIEGSIDRDLGFSIFQFPFVTFHLVQPEELKMEIDPAFDTSS
jgi:hypothetical protein